MSVCSCDRYDLKGFFMPTGDGVEKRFEQSRSIHPDLKNRSVNTSQSYSFYAAADPHIDRTHTNLSQFNNVLRNDSDASFGIILGDCTDVRDNLHNYLEALFFNPDRHAYDQTIFHVLDDNRGERLYGFG